MTNIDDTKYDKFYFVPCGVSQLNPGSFYNEDGSWKGNRVDLEKQYFVNDATATVMNPDFRKYGPTDSHAYKNYTAIWIDDAAKENPLYEIIDGKTRWNCGPTDLGAVEDNAVPNCGYWTNKWGTNRRNATDKHFLYQMRSGNQYLNMFWCMGYGQARKDGANGGGTIKTQPFCRENNIIGVDTYIHAERQSAGTGTNKKETRLGVTDIFMIYNANITLGDLMLIDELLECLLDPDCELPVKSDPITVRTIQHIVSFFAPRGFGFSEEQHVNYMNNTYTAEMLGELKSYILEDAREQYGSIPPPSLPDGRSGTGAAMMWLIEQIIKKIIKDFFEELLGGGSSDTDPQDYWLGDMDFLISLNQPTPVNDLKFWKKAPSSNQEGQAAAENLANEWWGDYDDYRWGWKHVSMTCDPVYHAAVVIFGATFNGYAWNFSHSAGGTRIRKMEFANVFPIRTVGPGIEPDDPIQDQYLAACQYWDKNLGFHDSPLTKNESRIMNWHGGYA